MKSTQFQIILAEEDVWQTFHLRTASNVFGIVWNVFDVLELIATDRILEWMIIVSFVIQKTIPLAQLVQNNGCQDNVLCQGMDVATLW